MILLSSKMIEKRRVSEEIETLKRKRKVILFVSILTLKKMESDLMKNELAQKKFAILSLQKSLLCFGDQKEMKTAIPLFRKKTWLMCFVFLHSSSFAKAQNWKQKDQLTRKKNWKVNHDFEKTKTCLDFQTQSHYSLKLQKSASKLADFLFRCAKYSLSSTETASWCTCFLDTEHNAKRVAGPPSNSLSHTACTWSRLPPRNIQTRKKSARTFRQSDICAQRCTSGSPRPRSD